MISMTALAEIAGVSRATVSHVLNERDTNLRISQSTKAKVLEIAAQHGYQRNELFRSAVSGKSRMIGFVARSPRPEPIARILDGAVSAAEAPGYTIKVLKVSDNRLDQSTIDRCIQLRLAAVLTLHQPLEALERLHEALLPYQIPLAVLDSHIELPWGVQVEADDASALRLAVEHLAGLGHQNIAFLSGVPQTPMSLGREAAFLSALQSCGLPRGPICHSLLERESSIAAVRQLLGQAQRPTALIGITDSMAMTALRAARLSGLDVPRDLSVVGYGGMSLSEFADPPLTTVVQPFEEIGRVAIESLLERVHSTQTNFSDGASRHQLPARLWERQSTAAPDSQPRAAFPLSLDSDFASQGSTS